MTNKTKKSLFVSILSMVLCISMLLGSTFAWFTDTAVNTNNRVKAGSLDVQLLKYNGESYVDISEGSGNVFNDGTVKSGDNLAKVTRWEPNKTEVVLLQVKNNGNLALDYNIYLDIASSGFEAPLEEVMSYAIISDMDATAYAAAGLADWAGVLDITEHSLATGSLSAGLSKVTPRNALLKGESKYFALAVHMDENAGNEYQNLTLTIDVNVEAQQKSHEEDSFGNTYDASATMKNLLESGGFEALSAGELQTDSLPWSKYQASNSSIITGVVDSSSSNKLTISGEEYDVPMAQEGDKFAYTYLTQGTGSMVQRKDIAYMAGAEYKLSAWVYIATNMGTPMLSVSYDGTSDKVNQDLSIPTGEWTKVEVAGLIPEGARRIKLGLAVKGGNTATDTTPAIIYWDDVQLWVDATADLAAKWQAQLVEEDLVSQYSYTGGARQPLTPGQNLIQNGSFTLQEGESLQDIGWYPFVNSDIYMTAGNVTDGYEGGSGQALRFTKTETANSKILWQTKRIAVSEEDWGDEYQLSYYYRIENSQANTSVYTSIQYWTEGHQEFGQEAECYVTQTKIGPEKLYIADGEWHFTYETFIIPEGKDISWMEVIPRVENPASSTSGAYVDFDEFMLYKTCDGGSSTVQYGSNGTFSLDTDGTIFYTDFEQTEFSITVSEEAKDYYAGASVQFEVYDGEAVIWKPETVSFAEGVAKVDFELSNMIKLNAPYCVKATIYGADGNEVWTVTKELYMFERPEALDENGKYIKFGKDFVPIFGYHVNSNEDMIKAKEAGINVVQLSARESAEKMLSLLDNCASIGVKGMVCLYPNMIPAASGSSLYSTINVVSDPRIQNHEALFGYVVMDEPFYLLGEAARESVIEGYRLVRQYDKKNVVFHTENLPEKYEESAELSDVILADVYANAKSTTVYRELSEAAKASTVAGTQKSLWALLMSFDYESVLGYKVYEDDVRNNNWQALIAGSDSLGYFSISDAGSVETSVTVDKTKYPDGKIAVWEMEYGNDTTAGARMWNAMCEFNEKEKDVANKHFILDEGSTLMNEFVEDDHFAYSWADEAGKVYVVLLNVKDADNTVSLTLKNADGSAMSNYSATVIAGRSSDIAGDVLNYTGTDGQLTVQMTGVEALLLEVQ